MPTATAGTAPILIGLGANLPSTHGPPLKALEMSLASLQASGVSILAVAPWYESAPVPLNDQPWFINTVAAVDTELAPSDFLALLHEVERKFGRLRRERWEARVLDIDLLDYKGMLSAGPEVILPHPRMAERAFVLLPLRDLIPDWRHPESGRSVAELVGALPADQQIRRLLPCEPA